MSDKLHLNVREAAAFLGVSVSFLNKARMAPGRGPDFVKISKRVVYPVDTLRAFAEANRRTSTLDQGAGMKVAAE